MTWALILGLAVGAYTFKFVGLVVLGSRRFPAPLERCLTLVPAALLTALILENTLALDGDLVVDERAAGVAVAAVAAWRRAPFVVVVAFAAATTAVLRRI